VAVAAGDVTAGVWSAPRVGQTGLVGAGVSVVLVGALAALVVITDTSSGNAVGWFIWLVLYPLSPLLGYDLATRGAGGPGGPVLRAGGYSEALAVAHLAVAVGIAVGAAAGLHGRSPLWFFLVALCVVVVAPARALGIRVTRGLRGGGWALLGVAVFFLLMAWLIYMVAFTYWIAEVDS
jgi:hypothetical protein